MSKIFRENGLNIPGSRIGSRVPSPAVDAREAGCRRWRTTRLLLPIAALLLLLSAGCAKYNIFYNAEKAFNEAEHVRDEAIKKNEDPPPPSGNQKTSYETAIQKAQKVLDEYPGHSLSDDALFLQAKSWHRLESYRMSIRKLDLLFQNFPATPYLEEALYLQGLNYLLIGAVPRSQDYLDQLVRNFPESDLRAEVLKVTGDNAYALESWQEAVDAYRQYLDQEREIKERDRVGLKLAECHWELGEYRTAAAVLQEVVETATSRELRFHALLLQARVHVRLGDHDVTDRLLEELRTEAELYQARGEVVLVEAENLIARDRHDEATPLLENMPAEWQTPTVKARSKEILGHEYLARSKWYNSRQAFKAALARPKDLDDPEGVRRLHKHLNVFLAASRAIADARPAAVPRNRLLQANAMRFGFGRPNVAARIYKKALADSAIEDAVAARALYGAYLTYRDELANPDSAAIFAAQLDSLHPASPQAFEVRNGGTGDLLGYLLDLREQEQAENYAALSDEERDALAAGLDTGGRIARSRPGRDGAPRRRLVYLQRRENILYPPTDAELAYLARKDELRSRATARAAADTVGASTPTIDTRPPRPSRDGPPEIGADPRGRGDPVGVGGADQAAGLEDDAAADEEDDEDEEEAEEEEKPKKETFDLRTPDAGPQGDH